MSEFTIITKKDFEDFLPENFIIVDDARSKEIIYEYPASDSRLSVRIYSSINVTTQDTRDLGKDAIRCVLIDKKSGKPLDKGKRTHRMSNWRERLQEKLNDLHDSVKIVKFCKTCGSAMALRTKGTNAFYGCVRYPLCTTTLSLDGRYREAVNSDMDEKKVSCPKCNAIMRKRSGRFGDFYGCSNYPSCRGIRKLQDVEIYGHGVMQEPEPAMEENINCEALEKRIEEREIQKQIQSNSKYNDVPTDDSDIELVQTEKFPHLSFKFPTFNPVQSRVFEYYDEDCNMVICASTSSGKTTVAEMVMSEAIHNNKKTIFLSPLKAVSQEKYDDWTDENHDWSKLNVSIVTGDYQLTEKRVEELNNANIIIQTTEMLDSRTRRIETEKNDWLMDVGVLVVDEAHLLCIEGRGDKEESALMRFTKQNPSCRIILLSATMPNVSELAEWLTSLNGKETKLINSGYRPCKLDIHYHTYNAMGKYSVKEANKIREAIKITQEHKDDKFIIFVHSKATGRKIYNHLKDIGENVEIHNAELNLQDRLRVEKSFKSRDPKSLRLIVATSTLAWGCHKFGDFISMSDGSRKKVEQISVGDNVLSFNGINFESDRITRIGDKQVEKSYYLTLSSGESCEVTEDHLFFGANKRNCPDWIPITKLKIGDYIAVPHSYNLKTNVEFDEKFYLLGFISGDGCICKADYHADGSEKFMLDIAFNHKTDIEHIEYIRSLFFNSFNYEIPNARPDTNGVLHIVSKKRDVLDFFTKYLVVGRKEQWSIHDKLLINNKINSFLQGLFDADGGIVNHNNDNFSIEFTSISLPLIKQVQHLLLLYGIRSEIGKRKAKDSIINGRLQKAVRENFWRIRIYNKEIIKFKKQIGFKIKRKQEYLIKLFNKGFKEFSERDILPVRNLIEKHATANDISPYKLCKSIKNDYWSILNRKELRRETVYEIIEKYPNYSELNDLYNANILWKKITNIEKKEGGFFRDIEVEKNHCYVGEGMISHNCNLPARRVIVVGVHRGLNEVEPLDIKQEVGRSGRVGFDPKGDAYVLLPDTQFSHYKNWCENIPPILSTMNNPDVLAFHVVSEIEARTVYDVETLIDWYNRSLAAFQNDFIDRVDAEALLKKLEKLHIIELKNGKYRTTRLGQVASHLYFSPYTIAGWYLNFNRVFKEQEEKHPDDIPVSWALANIPEYGKNFVPKDYKEEVADYKKRCNLFGLAPNDGTGWVGYCFHACLKNLDIEQAQKITIKYDIERTVTALDMIDSRYATWGKGDFWKKLQLRIQYEVSWEHTNLCTLKGIGGVYVRKLFDAGITTIGKLKRNKETAISALGKKTYEKVVKENNL